MNDNNEIAVLLNEFFNQMNRWEKLCNELEDDNSLSNDDEEKIQRQKLKEIFDRYCTQKNRKQGRLNIISYGAEGSYEYNPKQELVRDVFIENNKAIVNTLREKPMEEKMRYSFKKVNDKWLIDSKERYSSYLEKWVSASL